jgi:hypothetical protein
MEAYDRATETNILKKCQNIPNKKFVLTSRYLCAHTKFHEKSTLFCGLCEKTKNVTKTTFLTPNVVFLTMTQKCRFSVKLFSEHIECLYVSDFLSKLFEISKVYLNPNITLEQPKERHTTDVKFYCMCAQRATHN